MSLPSILSHLFFSSPPEESTTLVLPPDWLLLLVFMLLVFVIAWLLLRSTRYSEAEAGALGHSEAHNVEVHTQPAPVATKAEHVAVLAPIETKNFESPAEILPTTAVIDSAQPDDLTQIEGIGSKIASVLQAAGISTFAQLAQAEPASLSEILSAQNLHLADPGSWPEQARLAAAGDWEAFNTLVARLKGGRSE